MAKTQTNQKPKTTYNMRNSLVNYYLLLMFSVFEMYLTYQYANARKDKFHAFIVLTTALLISVVVVSLEYFLESKAHKNNKISEEKSVFSLSVTDYAFCIFIIFSCITTLISDYRYDSFMGSAGRDNGTFIHLLYFLMYFVVSRFYIYKDYVLCAFMAFGCIISGLAILNFFYIDPLGIYQGYGEKVIEDFSTTIGNKNLVSSYMCVFLSTALALFICTKTEVLRTTALIGTIFGYLGLLVADSSSGYFGLIATLFALLLYSVKEKELLKNFFLSVTVMFSSGLLLRFLSAFMKNKGIADIGRYLVNSNLVFILIGVLSVITLCLYYVKSKKENTIWPGKLLTYAVISLGAVALATFVVLMYKYTVLDKSSDIGELASILRFDDRWGTHRGFFWIKGMDEFFQFDFIHKLFGSGCDTFYYVFEPYFKELHLRFGNTDTNCAHNEYINYLVTQGILGLISYLAIIITVIIRALKASKHSNLAIVFVIPVIAYSVQAVVNITQPITTPFLFIFIALSEAVCRNAESA